jgi:hypothetical protein
MAAKAKAKDRQLKAYWAELDGLNDWVVAAPNRAEALKAFGVRQDLFAQGEAGEASEGDAIEAARAQPLTPLRRPRGSSEPFAPATGFTDWSAAISEAKPPAKSKAAPSRPNAKAPPPESPKPDRRPLDRAKAELATIETRRRDALNRLAEDRAQLDDRQARLEADFAKQIGEARRAVEAAERAFRQAGGD